MTEFKTGETVFVINPLCSSIPIQGVFLSEADIGELEPSCEIEFDINGIKQSAVVHSGTVFASLDKAQQEVRDNLNATCINQLVSAKQYYVQSVNAYKNAAKEKTVAFKAAELLIGRNLTDEEIRIFSNLAFNVNTTRADIEDFISNFIKKERRA